MLIEAGRLLNNRYRLIRPIGHGAQGSVWVAEHLALNTNIAVKLIDPELAKKESARERFRREATAAAQLRSAHVVQILDHGIDDDQPFIVMELLDGEDLFERLAHRGRLPLRETSKIITQVARALSRAHQAQIVHRDLKPENVFLVPNDDDEMVKVLDFGVAKVNSPDKTTMQRTGVGTLIGTPHYMSPEQVKGISEVDFRTDLWALGVITYQCVTGELPFDSEGVGDLLIRITIGDAPVPSKVLPSLPPTFDAWFARACERDPAKRFQSAREMALALASVVSAIAEVPRVGTVRPPGKKSVAPSKLASTRPAPASSSTPSLDVPPAPRAMRPLLVADDANDASSIDFEEVDETEQAVREMFDSTEIDFDDEPEMDSRFSHVEFPLLVRAGTSQQKAAAAALSEPDSAKDAPPAEASAKVPDASEILPLDDAKSAPANEPGDTRPEAEAGEAGEAGETGEADEEDEAATDAGPSSSKSGPVAQAEGTESSAPAAALAQTATGHSESRPSSPKAPPSARGSTVSGLARPGLLPNDPPPELDGSKRRRMVRILVVGLVLGAVFVVWSVVRSQPHPVPATVPPEATTTVAPLPPPPPSVEPSPAAPTTTTTTTTTATTTATAVDPGKRSKPSRSAPSTKGKQPRRSPKKPPAPGEIEIPDGPDE